LILIAAALGPVGPAGQTPARAQSAGVGEGPDPIPNSPSVNITPTMSYQGKLMENGVPVTGSRSMTFRLWDAPSGGNWYWEEGPKTVSVNNGLFSVSLGDTNPFNVGIFNMQLYLEIDVAGTILPRQLLQGAPYAMSLAPGAEMSGDQSWSLLYAKNLGGGEGIMGESGWGSGLAGYSSSGHGVYAQSGGSGFYGAALQAKNTHADGIALVAQNYSTSDAALVVENDGTGDLLKGFGGDGGNDEFSFKNDGTFQDKAPSYIFIPGAGINLSTINPGASVLSSGSHGSVFVDRTGNWGVCLPITLPTVLYGQAVKIEQVRIYYWSNDSRNYIGNTSVQLFDSTGQFRELGYNPTIQNSSSMSSFYDVNVPYGALSADNGLVSVCFSVTFGDMYNQITFAGARLKLRHHPLN